MRFTKWSSLRIMLGVVMCFAFLVAFEKQPPREILIKFKPEAHSTQVDSLISALSLTKVKSIEEIDVDVFQVPSELSVAEVVQLCSTLPFVVYAEPTMAVRTRSGRGSAPLAEPTAAFQPQAQTADYRPGEVIVKFKSTVNQQQADSFLADVGIEVAERYNELGILKCTITGSKEVLTVVAECNADQNIEYAEPNYIYRRTIVPNDPSFSSLFGMRIIDAPEAWDVQTGSKAIIVGVIDTGVDQDHEDLQANTWTNPGESGGGKETNNIDDDGNGLIDDFRGWDFINNDNNPFDDNDHGTHVSGTIGAVGNNSVGVTGVNWNVSIMALKFLGGDGSGDTGDAVEAIIYGTNQGAKVLSNSWGGGGRSQALEDAIRFANDRGVLFVAAAGNASSNNDTFPSFPANYQIDNVVSVASSTSSDDISSFSNTGRRSVHLAAPGSAILSTKPRNQYQNLSGTSMATPHVSGAAALVWAQFPSLTMAEVKIRILGSVDRKNSFAGKVITGGRLNVNKALSTNPIIANTTQLENSLNEAGPYVVEADILDDGSIQSASLTYQVVGQSAVPLPMNLVSGHQYRGEIPGQALGTNITYFVKASDTDGNETQDANFSFSIAEPADPGCGCGKPAIDLTMTNPGLRTAVNAVVNLSFFVLPVVLIRNRMKRRK